MAGKPSQNDTKKVETDESSSDSDSSVAEIECETCGVSFTTVKNYKAHMQGKKHHKKVVEAKYKAKSLASSKKRAEKEHEEKENDEDDSDDDSDKMYCEVCEKYLSSYVSYATHLKGSSHAKNLKKEKLKKQLKDMPEVIQDDNDSENDDFLLKPYAKCKACQKQFSGPEAFKMHMKSVAHKKKVKQSGVLQKLKSELPDGEKKGSDDDDEEFYKKCDTCQKSFSGVVPYRNHMFSKTHLKNLEKKKIAEEIKEFYDSDEGYICKECKKSFTDPLAFKLHQKNNSHEKQKAKAALKEFLSDHPEIQFVIPAFKEGDSNGDDSDDNDSTYYLICKLCQFSFSGPESAQDHVKSKKHVNLKKEKKMLKLMKQQKENSVKCDGETSKSKGNSPASAKSKSAKDDAHNAEDFEMI